MDVRRWSARVAATLTTILAAGALAVPAGHAATSPVPGPATTADEITVAPDARGTTLTWHPDKGLPIGDARPEFRVAGRTLGIPAEVGDALRLRLTGVSKLKAAQVSVVSGGRVLAGSAQGLERNESAKVPTVPAVTQVLAKDPGTPGKYTSTEFSYTLPAVTIPGYTQKVEMRGHVVAPVGANGHRGVVLFLHGRHYTCYTPGTEDINGDWPCAAPMRPVPSYLGYRTQQKLLASQGFVTVSISANGINAQDGDDVDSGAAARAILVRRHLDLLADWEAGKGSGPDERLQLAGHLNMRKVMTVGHSRGGEGVNRAAIKARANDRFTIVGQVLVAPTDFGQQVAVGLPTTVLLPYCDGDVFDLQGQMYVDQGAALAAGDRSLKSSVLVIGANHNYFNSQWTPKISQAPSSDDWWDPSDPVCGDKAPQRLTAAQQRSVGATYIAAAARTYLTTDTSALPLLDGTSVRAKSAGKAVVLTHATGGRRTTLVRASAHPVLTAGPKARAVVCLPSAADDRPTCDPDHPTDSPHWTPETWGTFGNPSPAIKIDWTAKGARVALTPTHALGSSRYIDLRVVVPNQASAPTFDVLVRDSAGKLTVLPPVRSVSVLPGALVGSGWAQDVRVAVPKGLVLRSGASIVLRSTSTRGQVYLLDVYGSASGIVPSTASTFTVPVLDVPAATVLPADRSSDTAVVHVPVRSTGTVSGSFELSVFDLETGDVQSAVRTVQPGQTSVDLTVARPPWDDAYNDPSSGAQSTFILARAVKNSVVDGYVGLVSSPSGAPRPHFVISQVDASAAPGESLRWEVRLSGPVASDVLIPVKAVAPSGASAVELTGVDLLPGWARWSLAGPVTAQPISTIGFETYFVVPAYQTSATLEVPIRTGVSFTGQRQLELRADTSQFGDPITTFTGTVTAP